MLRTGVTCWLPVGLRRALSQRETYLASSGAPNPTYSCVIWFARDRRLRPSPSEGVAKAPLPPGEGLKGSLMLRYATLVLPEKAS